MTNPSHLGTGTGDGINFTNVSYGVIRDHRSYDNARSNIVLTTFNAATSAADPSLSVGCIVENPKSGPCGYVGAEVNFEKVTGAKLLGADIPESGVTFRDSPDCEFIRVKCKRINGTEGTHRTKIRDLDVFNPDSSASLLVVTGDSPDVQNVRIASTAPRASTAVELRPADRRGHVHNIDIDGANNAINVDVDNISGITGRNVDNTQVRYGPAGTGQNIPLGFSAALKVNNGVAEFLYPSAPTAGVWVAGSVARRTAAASGQPAFWQYSAGSWVAGPAWP